MTIYKYLNAVTGNFLAASILFAALAFAQAKAQAQPYAAVKTNLLYDAATTVNIGGEVKMSPKWTMELTAGYNGWEFSGNKQWKNWYAMPELRRWLCDAWDGHFFALHAFGGQYNMGGVKAFNLNDTRRQGWFAGAGLAYGYDWMLSRHWNLEAELGVGYAYTRYDRFRCAGCGKKIETDKPRHYFGPTKLAINLMFVF